MNIDYGPLHRALASLRPQEVHAYLRDQPPIVRIKPFGMRHREYERMETSCRANFILFICCPLVCMN